MTFSRILGVALLGFGLLLILGTAPPCEKPIQARGITAAPAAFRPVCENGVCRWESSPQAEHSPSDHAAGCAGAAGDAERRTPVRAALGVGRRVSRRAVHGATGILFRRRY